MTESLRRRWLSSTEAPKATLEEVIEKSTLCFIGRKTGERHEPIERKNDNVILRNERVVYDAVVQTFNVLSVLFGGSDDRVIDVYPPFLTRKLEMQQEIVNQDVQDVPILLEQIKRRYAFLRYETPLELPLPVCPSRSPNLVAAVSAPSSDDADPSSSTPSSLRPDDEGSVIVFLNKEDPRCPGYSLVCENCYESVAQKKRVGQLFVFVSIRSKIKKHAAGEKTPDSDSDSEESDSTSTEESSSDDASSSSDDEGSGLNRSIRLRKKAAKARRFHRSMATMSDQIEEGANFTQIRDGQMAGLDLEAVLAQGMEDDERRMRRKMRKQARKKAREEQGSESLSEEDSPIPQVDPGPAKNPSRDPEISPNPPIPVVDDSPAEDSPVEPVESSSDSSEDDRRPKKWIVLDPSGRRRQRRRPRTQKSTKGKKDCCTVQ